MATAKLRAGRRTLGAGVVLASAAASLLVPGCLDPLVEDPGVNGDVQSAPGAAAPPGVPVGAGGAGPTSTPGGQSPPASTTRPAADGDPVDDTSGEMSVAPSDGPVDPATTPGLSPAPVGDGGLAESAEGDADAAKTSRPGTDAGPRDAGVAD